MSTCFLFLSLPVAMFSAHVLSPLDQFHQSFQLFLSWHIRVQRQHFRAHVFFSDFYFVMVMSMVSMFPLMEAVFVVGVVKFAFVLSPVMESSFSSMVSAVFITSDMIIWYLSAIRNQDIFLLKWKWRAYKNVSNNKCNQEINLLFYKRNLPLSRSVRFANNSKNVLKLICNDGVQFQTEIRKLAIVIHVP